MGRDGKSIGQPVDKAMWQYIRPFDTYRPSMALNRPRDVEIDRVLQGMRADHSEVFNVYPDMIVKEGGEAKGETAPHPER